jgi:RecB family exonuclease
MVDRAISCPFRAFVERALGVRRAEELSDTHGPRERGTLLHRALLVAFDEDKRIRGTHSPEQRLLACRQVIAQELAREPFGVLRAEGVRRIGEEAVAVVEFDLQREHDALYDNGEQRFGSREGSRFPPLSLRASDGTEVWLEGQIDRIDVDADRTMARVVDYKTGKVQTKRIGVTQMQLPLYAAVLRENGFAKAEACYITVGAGGAISVQPSKAEDQKWPDEKLIDVKTHSADVIVSLWRGLVPPRPESPSACKHCEHRGICRRPAIALELEDE